MDYPGIRAALDKHMPNNWTLTESGGGSIEIQGVLKATNVVVVLRGTRESVLKVLNGLLWAQDIANRMQAEPQAE